MVGLGKGTSGGGRKDVGGKTWQRKVKTIKVATEEM